MRIDKWKAGLVAFAIIASQVAAASADTPRERRAEFRQQHQIQRSNRNFSPRVTRSTVPNTQRVAPQRFNFNRTIVRERFNNNSFAPRRWSGNWYHYRHRDRDFASGLLVFSLGGLFYPTGVSYYGAPPYNAPCFNDFYGFYGYFHDGYCYREPGPF